MPVNWPGVGAGIEAASYSASGGVLPGIATLVVHPAAAARAAKYGDLVLSDGIGGVVRVVGCLYDSANASAGGSGARVQLHLKDRRWSWGQTAVSGRYNDPDDLNPPDPKPRKLRDLLQALLQRVNEQAVLQSIPDTEPMVNWENQPVAACLAELCDRHGLRVCPRLDRRETLIAPAGQGGPLPSGHMAGRSPGFDPPEPPEKLVLVGAPKEYQARIPLEACGEEFDGSVKRLNELSYRPEWDEEWEHQLPGGRFPNLVAVEGHTVEEARALAEKSVWRYYRPKRSEVKGKKGESVRVHGYDKKGENIRLDWRRVMLSAVKVETVTDAEKRETRLPADVFGTYWGGKVKPAAEGDANQGQRIPFTVDTRRNIVIFSQPMLKVEDGNTKPAELWLECAVTIRDPLSNQPERYAKEKHLGGPPGTFRHITREDVTWGRIADYNDQGNFSGTRDWTQEKRADYYLDAAAREYEAVASDSATYNGLRPDIQLDGAIQQVSHSVGGGSGARTQASLNTEHQFFTPPYLRKLQTQLPYEEIRRTTLAIRRMDERLRHDRAHGAAPEQGAVLT